jgi:putative ABC transport system permease protein
LEIENRPLAPGKFQSALRMTTSKGYFSAFHIPMISGRGFNPGDDLRSQPVALVSRDFVTRYFPGENPLGHRIRMGASGRFQTPWMTIAGVVGEADYSLFVRSSSAAVYIDAAQMPPDGIMYSVITGGDPLAMAPAARKALAGLDPALPLDGVETYAVYMHEKLIGLAYVAVLLGVDALIALLLASIGIFAVMANLVAERTREIGVRLAMGARREDVLGMILRRATILTSTGLAIGLLLAVGIAHGVANLLYGVSPDDPVVFGGIAFTIALIALGSSWIPAHRAAHVDPMAALHDE